MPEATGTLPAHRWWMARQVLRVVVFAAAVLAVSLPPQPGWSAPSGGPAQPARTHRATPGTTVVKYYVVTSPADGQREYLYGIASRVLGNGNRYKEIFDLNKDRLQPDGDRLTDPLVLKPGWILVLPPDASGPGVRTGQLPAVSTAPTGAATPSVAAAAPPPAATEPGDADTMWRWIAAVSAALALIMVGIRLRVRARLRQAAVPAPGLATSPPALPNSASPALALPASAPPTSSAPVLALPASAGSARSDPAPTGAGPASPSPQDGLELSAELIGHGQPVAVSLIGSRAKARAFTWVAGDAEPPVGAAPALLGEQGGRRLYVDLALAPDVVTVVGGLPESQRYARELATLLSAAGVEVAVLGDALGSPAPAGCRRITAMPGPVATGEAHGPVSVVFCAEPDATERRQARDLCARGDGRVVPILLGAVPRSRWSMRVDPVRQARAVAIPTAPMRRSPAGGEGRAPGSAAALSLDAGE